MNYSINVNLPQNTLQVLKSSGSQLCAFKAAAINAPGAAPVVWASTSQYMMQTPVQWADSYQAYISTTQIMQGAQIFPTSTYDIALGQTLTVNGNGMGSVSPGGSPTAVSILNSSGQQSTVGLSEQIAIAGNVQIQPTLAVPLYPQMMTVIEPRPSVLLAFATSINAGTVMFMLPAQGLLIDMGSTSSSDVSFDINSGWSGGANTRVIPANTNLASLLLQ